MNSLDMTCHATNFEKNDGGRSAHVSHSSEWYDVNMSVELTTWDSE